MTDNITPKLTPAPGIPAPEKVQRILICQLRQIGDVILSTIAVELLAAHYPQAEIHFFTEKKCRPMLENNPHIHKIWELDKEALPTIFQQIAYYWKVGRNNFDIVVNFQHLPRCTWVTAFSGAPVRLAITPPWYLRMLYTHTILPPHGYAGGYKAHTLRPLGIEWHKETPRLYLTEAERSVAQNLLGQMGLNGKKFISVDATHKHRMRRWTAKNYAQLMDGLAEQMPELYFMFTFGPGEEGQVDAIRNQMRHKERAALLPGVQSLRLVAACMEQSAMHIGNCSAPRHIAVALNVPSFTIMGASSQAWNFPLPQHCQISAKDFYPELTCQPCRKRQCDNAERCITDLTPELVLPKAMEHFKKYAK